MSEDIDVKGEGSDAGCECSLGVSGYRCAVEDCPRRANPVSDLLASLEELGTDFELELQHVDSAVDAVRRDLEEPAPVSWEQLKGLLALFASYAGVFSYLLAYSYLRAYHVAVLGRLPVSYGYLETLVTAASTLLSFLLLATPLLVTWMGISLSLSGKTRRLLGRAYVGAASLTAKAKRIRAEFEKWKPIITEALEESSKEGSLEVDLEAAEEDMRRLSDLVDSVQTSADKHVDLVSKTMRLEAASGFCIRVAYGRHSRRTIVSLMFLQVLLLLALLAATAATSGDSLGIARGDARVAIYVLTVLSLASLWFLINVFTVRVPATSRSALFLGAQLGLLVFSALLGVFVLLGHGDGTYARAHPSELFDSVTVRLTDGSSLGGYLVPTPGSGGVYLLESVDESSTARLVPLGRIDQMTTSPE